MNRNINHTYSTTFENFLDIFLGLECKPKEMSLKLILRFYHFHFFNDLFLLYVHFVFCLRGCLCEDPQELELQTGMSCHVGAGN